MRNLRLITTILVLLIPTVMTAQPTNARRPKRSYSTRFQLDEDPVNGVEVISATDNTYKEGNPGMGFNFGVENSNGDFGFTSYEVESYDN